MHCNIEFFSIHNAADSQLSTALPKQHIAFISGISQPCNSSSGLHAPFTTCRMSCTRRRYKGQKTGMTSKKCYVFASKCVPCFLCVCMCWCAGYSHKCDILSWRQQQVTASVCKCSPAGFDWAPCTVDNWSYFNKNVCAFCLLLTGSAVFGREHSKRKIAWLAHSKSVISLTLWYKCSNYTSHTVHTKFHVQLQYCRDCSKMSCEQRKV